MVSVFSTADKSVICLCSVLFEGLFTPKCNLHKSLVFFHVHLVSKAKTLLQ